VTAWHFLHRNSNSGIVRFEYPFEKYHARWNPKTNNATVQQHPTFDKVKEASLFA
jgi:hypothetical protein